jgi:recombination protein RecA
MMNQTDKMKAVRSAIGAIEKQFGKGTVMTLGEESAREAVAVIPTGSLGLDAALGVGGYPRGRIVEVYGPESSGKTTLTLHAIAQVQRAGGVAAFIDAEHALDTAYARPSASTSAACSSRSPTRASRRWRSSTPSCARAPSTSW